ncbi:MAG: hypothetical protein AAGN66_30370 [Acidobacteriota bacterium]
MDRPLSSWAFTGPALRRPWPLTWAWIFAGLLAVAASSAGASGLPVCPLNNEPAATAAGRRLVGVSAKELNPLNPDLPSPAEVARLLAKGGAAWVGNKLHWERLEPVAGEPRWEIYDDRFAAFTGHGLTPVVTLRGTAPWASSEPDAENPALHMPRDLDDWRDFVTRVVQRYGPAIRHWEIWNEPNQPQFFLGDADDYLELLRTAYGAIRAVQPEARVWGPAVIFHPWSHDAYDFVQAVIDDGSFDVLSIHLYFFDVEAATEVATTVRGMLDAAGRGSTPLRVTETNRVESIVDCGAFNGWPESDHAAQLDATYACLSNVGVDTVFWFKATDTGLFCDEAPLLDGLLGVDLEPTEPYHRLRALAAGLQAASSLFTDGFETGGTARWSRTHP